MQDAGTRRPRPRPLTCVPYARTYLRTTVSCSCVSVDPYLVSHALHRCQAAPRISMLVPPAVDVAHLFYTLMATCLCSKHGSLRLVLTTPETGLVTAARCRVVRGYSRLFVLLWLIRPSSKQGVGRESWAARLHEAVGRRGWMYRDAKYARLSAATPARFAQLPTEQTLSSATWQCRCCADNCMSFVCAIRLLLGSGCNDVLERLPKRLSLKPLALFRSAHCPVPYSMLTA